MDALAFEPHFLDHIAPVWSRLPDKGRLIVNADLRLVERAVGLGLDAEGMSGVGVRSQSAPPKAKPGDGPLALVASIGDMKVGRRLGYRRFIFLEHGSAQSYSGRGKHAIEASYSGGPDREDVVLFLVPNEHAARRWRATYPRTPVAVVGCPKLDDLPQRQDDSSGPVVCISFHWSTPTGLLPPEAGNALGTFGRVLPDLAKRFSMIGHGHPRHGDTMARIYRRVKIEWVPDFANVCRRADLYVCDNSSTLFEFAATGRPVVVMNDRRYRKDADHGLRFWEAADVGVQVDDPDLLGDAIEEALRDAPERQVAREHALSIVYARRSGAADAAVDAITDFMASAKLTEVA